jgi:glycogen debranching enzyme
VAAIWIDALRRLRPVALALGDDETATRCGLLLARAEAGYRERLLDSSGRSLLHRMADGTPNDTLCALNSVPVLLGVESGANTVRQLLAPRFATPWGVRMLAADDPLYQPRGYHAGAVWPLYTGWLSLAAFATGEAAGGLDLLRANAALAFSDGGSAGAFAEVLDGDSGAPAGVCADQAWSAAMVISPAVYGLWGVRPDMLERSVTICPRLPDEWSGTSLTGVHVGGARVDVVMERHAPQARVYVVQVGVGGPSCARLDCGTGALASVLSTTGRATIVASGVIELSVGAHRVMVSHQ